MRDFAIGSLAFSSEKGETKFPLWGISHNVLTHLRKNVLYAQDKYKNPVYLFALLHLNKFLTY